MGVETVSESFLIRCEKHLLSSFFSCAIGPLFMLVWFLGHGCACNSRAKAPMHL